MRIPNMLSSSIDSAERKLTILFAQVRSLSYEYIFKASQYFTNDSTFHTRC